MLQGIHPLLTGELLLQLDAMGHTDAVVVADAHFPAARLATRVVELPAVGTPEVVAAIRSVLPLDDDPAIDLMQAPDGNLLEVQRELLGAAGVEQSAARLVGRYDFYDVAAGAFVIVRTGEERTYGNAILRKGLVTR
jgi:L-fucose mutarotase